ncbi:uncharacterized protein LOC124921647 [Impatiens glandulifera]|uniref:uncharacterized protein LOC124921647 n=1 Tax=Impatiens glandulifera TaxID=253017 RepID=UPI001FB06D43|nr:uncharacterized protein LOC124921647 [Impatiens glandulifera]
MGTKRSNEELLEFSYKHPKLISSLTESYPSCVEPVYEADVSDSSAKALEVSTPFSCVTNNTNEEDYRSGGTVRSPFFPDYFELHHPRGPTDSYDGRHSSMLDTPPRKHIPLGPNHQAELPTWDDDLLGSNHADMKKFMGYTVISMPRDDLAVDDVKVGDGKGDCCCDDEGSVRCVQQHLKEAREKLIENIGSDKFAMLGFCEMGEEVTKNWTGVEEDIFHNVVYANPSSSGKNFWNHLSVAFPCRTKKEIISYYFNVFILRRRAVQNRSNFLDIDSDDDEWQEVNENPKEDDMSLDYAYNNHGILLDNDDDSPAGNRLSGIFGSHSNYSEWLSRNHFPSLMKGLEQDDDDTSDEEEDDDTDNDDQENETDNYECNDDLEDNAPVLQTNMVNYAGKDVKHNNFAVEAKAEQKRGSWNESVTFECQHNNFAVEAKAERKKGSWTESVGGAVNGVVEGHGYLLDLSDVSRVWDGRYPTTAAAAAKDVDLLPTCNMMEEIFGESNSKSSDS